MDGWPAQDVSVTICQTSKQVCNAITVETPYNTAPYITGSNIARLGHGSQNSWSKLWIPIVKSAPVRVIFTWKSVPKKSFHGSSDIYLGTRWKQWHDSPWSYRSDVIVTFLCYGTIGIIWHRDHQSTAKEVRLTLIAFVYVLLAREHIDIGTPRGFLFASKMDPVRVTKITQHWTNFSI